MIASIPIFFFLHLCAVVCMTGGAYQRPPVSVWGEGGTSRMIKIHPFVQEWWNDIWVLLMERPRFVQNDAFFEIWK